MTKITGKYNYEINAWNAGFRVYVGSAWASFDLNGNILEKSATSPKLDGFPEDAIQEIQRLIPVLHKPSKERRYIRFNKVPECGYSTNWVTGKREAGVSAYQAQQDLITGHYTLTELLRGSQVLALYRGDPIYLITGTEVGVCSDGSSALTDVRVLSELEYSNRGYREKKEGSVTV